MSKYSPAFEAFSAREMGKRGTDIRKWVNDSNPVVSEVCKAVIEASQKK